MGIKQIKAKDLKIGMVSEDWDTANMTISSIKRIKRPSFKYALVQVTFDGGYKIDFMTTEQKMNIRA